MWSVYTGNRKSGKKLNTNTGNWQEQNLGTFWESKKRKRRYC